MRRSCLPHPHPLAKAMLFNLWLLRQIDWTDEVGELVRFLNEDQLAPLWSSEPERYRDYLAARQVTLGVMAALEKAIAKWRQAQTTENGR